MDHQLTAHADLSRYLDFNGCDILEIGGHHDCASARPFLSDGANSVTVTGLDHVLREGIIGDRLSVCRADATALTSTFASNSFDIVYGLSVVEHICQPHLFLDEVWEVLKPGGIAYFEGAPLWTSAKGHHLWVATWNGMDYEDKSSRNYLFVDLPNITSSNPLPDFSHLLMTPEDMRAHLSSTDVASSDIEYILHWVYENPAINRLGLHELSLVYTQSRLAVLEVSTTHSSVPSATLAKLRQASSQRVDYGVNGLRYILCKP